jgi:MFS family permease
MWMEMLVMGWLALELTDSAWWVSLLGFCRSIPLLFIGSWGAILTDRFPRRLLLIAFQGTATLGILLLCISSWWGVLAYWQLAIFSLLQGAIWALDWPTRRAIIPDLVGRERVVDAMVLENAIQNTTRIVGPLCGGWVLAAWGVGGSLVILLGIALVSLVFLWGIRSPSRAPGAPSSLGAALETTRKGWQFVRSNRRIWGVFLITIFMNVWAFPYMNLLPVFARDILGQGPVGLGWLGAAHGVGATLGLFLVHWARERMSNEWLFAGGSILLCLGLVAFALSASFHLSLLTLLVSGLGQSGFSIMQSGIILVESSDEMRSRVMGALVLAIGLGPLGRLQSGSMAEMWGAPLAVGGMAALAALGTLITALLIRGFLTGHKARV